MGVNNALRLKTRPVGRINNDVFDLVQEDLPTPEDGQCVVKNLYASIDPTHRIWLTERPQYMDNVKMGDVMRAATVGVVTESKSAEYPVGAYVYGFGGIADYYLGIPGVTVLYPVEKTTDTPLIAYASVLNPIIALSAWAGTNKVLKVDKDDVLVVSGASGAVGSLVGQLAKKIGATVIGIAGGKTKCDKILGLGFDHAIDYKSQNIDEELKKAAPDGITCYFDNVGGDITDAVFLNFRNHGRLVVCGAISDYEKDDWAGQKNFNMILMRRLVVQGFICMDYIDEFGKCKEDLMRLISSGELKYDEDVRTGGVGNYVDTVNDLFDGKNTGKLILQINEEE